MSLSKKSLKRRNRVTKAPDLKEARERVNLN